MKKVIISFTSIMVIMGGVFTFLAIKDYNDTKSNKNMEGKIEILESRKKEAEEEIKTKNNEIEKIKEEKQESVKELELWQKRVKEIEEALS